MSLHERSTRREARHAFAPRRTLSSNPVVKPPEVNFYIGDAGEAQVSQLYHDITQRLNTIDKDELEVLLAGLPNPSHRPLLTAALLLEMSQIEEKARESGKLDTPLSELIGPSRIAKIHRIPYAALHLPDVIDELGGLENIDINKLFEYFCGSEGKDRTKPINSSLRNALLAAELNKTVLRDSKYKARLAIEDYSWQGRLSTVHNQEAPELPQNYENRKLSKFVVTIVEESKGDDPAKRVMFFDYGETGGDANRETGEQLSMLSHWAITAIDPSNQNQLREGLRYIADTHGGKIGKVGVELLNKSRLLIDTVEMHALIDNFPKTLSKVEDLSESQIEALLQTSNMIMDMWETYSEDGELHYQRVVPWTDMLTALIQMKQASTRTVRAAKDAAKAVGLDPDELDQSRSSQAKGELGASERLTFKTHNIGAILSRDPQFESRTRVLEQRPVTGREPIRISLGGHRHHPTQTLAELHTIIEGYGCSTLAQLREVTSENPPTIVFVGHIGRKRADRSLIEFIAKHLPEWQIKVIVPKRKYLPRKRKKLDLPPGAKYEQMVRRRIQNQARLADATRGADFLYIANADATSGTKGVGDGLKKPDYYLSSDVVRINNLKVLHPLPASGELDPEILDNDELNRFIRRTMEYKTAIIASALLNMLASQQVRIAQNQATKV